MSKFNMSASELTQNQEGHAAYRMTDKAKLLTQVLTSFFREAKFYGDNSDELEKTLQSVIKSDPEFVSKLAVFARREFNMRSVSHFLTAYLAHEPQGKPFVRKTVRGVSLRGDDVVEIMAVYLETFGKPVPNSLKKGINDVLVTFDEYTLAKYKSSKKKVKMRDLLCICRPSPLNDEQSAMWKRCIENKLSIPMTWETELSANGNNAETWEKLIDSGKVGYMAQLRNLRNIIQAKPSNIEAVYKYIEDPEHVRKSKQLPFRFLSAYKSIMDIAGSRALTVLENAVNASVANMQIFPGTTVIAIDTSGSMSWEISENSQVSCYEIAILLGMLGNRICENSICFTFDTFLKKIPVSKNANILHTVVHSRGAGGGTNMHLPFEAMLKNKIKADRIIILSDNECNSSYHSPVQKIADEYRKKSGCDIWVHAIDLQGYGTQQFHGQKTNIIAGWSEKVFDFINLAEQGISSLETRIENYVWE